MSKQVQCVNKLDRPNPHERILNIGGVDSGVRWKRMQLDAIADVERDRHSYFVADIRTKQTVWVIVRVSQLGEQVSDD
jgi:hypothetical protein